ncbi:hypothetical protein E1B28_011362 [Marasmius oreades]|uniref:Uncharacterized protein n=1 Tax=Marasmius oreades TaxID=181124 RepID=A0A9P7RUK3_9AGAR|nr:uncharacterized protein E1B28_011362 [Marasmius oreades]KAG7089707.1 hypothetical protein E1B28_011362 [Marasmius oreades]
MPSQSVKSKGKAQAVEPEPELPSPEILDALEGNLCYIHKWVEGLYNRLVAHFTDQSQMLQEFSDHWPLLNDLREQLNWFQGEDWIIPALQLLALLSSFANEWDVPIASWQMGPTESLSLQELFGVFNFDAEPPVQYMPNAPRLETSSMIPPRVSLPMVPSSSISAAVSPPPAARTRSASGLPRVLASTLVAGSSSAVESSNVVAGPSSAVDSSNMVAGLSKPVSKCKAPESSTVESTRSKQSKIVKASVNRVTFAESSDAEASEPRKPYCTRSHTRKGPVATSELEAAATDRSLRQKSSQTSKSKGKAKESTENTGASVEELWTSGARSHVFPEGWIGAARNMELQFDLGKAKLSLESILKAGQSIAFFDRLTPCGRCTYFGYTNCKPIWAASGKAGHRPTCAQCFAGKQKCSFFDPDSSRAGLKKLEAASSNNLLLAKIALRLNRELQSYEQMLLAQKTTYNTAKITWSNIQESQRALWAAGRDPVEVFKGLGDDEDFKMTPSQVKALGDTLGWSLSGSAVEEVEENAPPSVPLPSSSINPPAPVATSGISKKDSEAEEEGDDDEESDESSSGSSSPSGNAVSTVAESATVQEEAEVPPAPRSEVEVTVKDLIDDKAKEASSDNSSAEEEEGDSEDKEESSDSSSPSVRRSLDPVSKAVIAKLDQDRRAVERVFGLQLQHKRA